MIAALSSITYESTIRTVLEDQYPSICIGNYGSRLMKKQSSTSINPPLLRNSKITPISLSSLRSRVWKDASNDGALRYALRCARISPVALPDLCNQAFGASETPQPAPGDTRAAHFDFDTLARLAPSKLQPRLSVLGRKPQASTRRRPTTLLGFCAAQH